MRKSKVLLSLLVVLALIFVSACSKKATPADSAAATTAPAASTAPATAAPVATAAPATAAATAAGKNVEFNYATFIGDVSTDQLGVAALAYQKLHPNVKIDFQTMDHDSYQAKLAILVDSNTLPDLFWWNGSTLSSTMTKRPDTIVDLTPYFDDAFKSKFLPGAFDFLDMSGGKIAGFPTEMQAQGWWYNDAIFKKFNLTFPKTFDELKADTKIFKAAGIVTIAQGTKDPWPLWAFYNWEQKWGIQEQQDDLFHTRKVHFQDSGAAHVYQDIGELHDLGAFPEDASTLNFDGMTSLFIAGKAAIIQLSSDQMGKFQGNPIANDMKFTWGIDFPDSPYPQHVAVKTVNNGYAIGSGVAKDKDKLDAIVNFNKWRYSDEGMDLALKAGFILPVKTSLDFSKYGPLIAEQAKSLQDDYKAVNMDIQYVLPNYATAKDTTGFGKFEGGKDALINAMVDGSITLKQLPAELAKLDKFLDITSKEYVPLAAK